MLKVIMDVLTITRQLVERQPFDSVTGPDDVSTLTPEEVRRSSVDSVGVNQKSLVGPSSCGREVWTGPTTVQKLCHETYDSILVFVCFSL